MPRCCSRRWRGGWEERRERFETFLVRLSNSNSNHVASLEDLQKKKEATPMTYYLAHGPGLRRAVCLACAVRKIVITSVSRPCR